MDAEQADWFYLSDGNRIGPINETRFRTLISNGTLTGHEKVWTGQFGANWKPLFQTEVWPQDRPPPVPSAPRSTVAERTVGGKICLTLFWVWQGLMGLWLVSALLGMASDHDSSTAYAIGATIGIALLLFVWVLGSVITGLMALLTKPKI